MSELRTVCSGTKRCVRMTDRVHKEYERLDVRTKAGLKAKMDAWVEGRQLSDKHYKWESRESCSGRSVPIYAFKEWQTRVYGSPLQMDGKETFICSEIDTAKKQNRANQEKLKRAAQNLIEFL